jgi:hypothetical protein
MKVSRSCGKPSPAPPTALPPTDHSKALKLMSEECEKVTGVAFVIVQAGNGLCGQCDLGNVVQFLWLCWYAGVPWDHIRAFMQNGLADKDKSWPDPRYPQISPTPLTPPADYEHSIVHTRTNLVEQAGDAICAFAKDRGVSRIVFVYVNHGARKTLDVPDHSPAFSIDNFVRWCGLAERRKKPILFVLDACHSTTFARRVCSALRDDNAGDVAGLDQFTGFLTSAGKPSFTSAIVVSCDPRLVYLLDETSQGDSQAQPGSFSQGGSLALGYRVSNSMFFRAFLLEVTYRLSLSDGVTIADLPDHMNVGGPFRHGFDAAFVPVPDPAAIPPPPPSQFGALALRDFFPWDRVQDATVVNDGTGVTFGDIIPSAPLGGLWDDISRFWRQGVRAKAAFAYAFVEIGLDEQGKKVVEKINEQDHLDKILGREHPLMKEVSGGQSCVDGQKRRALNPGNDGKSVSFGWIWLAFEERAVREELTPADEVPDDAYEKVNVFLEWLNGTVPTRESSYEWYLAEYAVGMNDDPRFQGMVVEARNEALSWEDKTKPDGSSGERGPDPPAQPCADDK